LKPDVSFKPYPSARSKPMWAVQMLVTQSTAGVDTASHATKPEYRRSLRRG
jgi:hypothetical protein